MPREQGPTEGEDFVHSPLHSLLVQELECTTLLPAFEEDCWTREEESFMSSSCCVDVLSSSTAPAPAPVSDERKTSTKDEVDRTISLSSNNAIKVRPTQTVLFEDAEVYLQILASGGPHDAEKFSEPTTSVQLPVEQESAVKSTTQLVAEALADKACRSLSYLKGAAVGLDSSTSSAHNKTKKIEKDKKNKEGSSCRHKLPSKNHFQNDEVVVAPLESDHAEIAMTDNYNTSSPAQQHHGADSKDPQINFAPPEADAETIASVRAVIEKLEKYKASLPVVNTRDGKYATTDAETECPGPSSGSSGSDTDHIYRTKSCCSTRRSALDDPFHADDENHAMVPKQTAAGRGGLKLDEFLTSDEDHFQQHLLRTRQPGGGTSTSGGGATGGGGSSSSSQEQLGEELNSSTTSPRPPSYNYHYSDGNNKSRYVTGFSLTDPASWSRQLLWMVFGFRSVSGDHLIRGHQDQGSTHSHHAGGRYDTGVDGARCSGARVANNGASVSSDSNRRGSRSRSPRLENSKGELEGGGLSSLCGKRMQVSLPRTYEQWCQLLIVLLSLVALANLVRWSVSFCASATDTVTGQDEHLGLVQTAPGAGGAVVPPSGRFLASKKAKNVSI
ncbi:unnamed protein product [Amoebophrya sp. A120]|nr:unnamed protein product [Amoebophrya sp. A120]|eukprot:GSA120T00011362001.1